MRIGIGFDVHRFAEDRLLVLGGLEIPHFRGLLGHSDADVLIHAIIDALLGALALGDIGMHFPDTDQSYKGANSIDLLQQVLSKILDAGYMIANIDATIMAEKPKLKSYILPIRNRLAESLNCNVDQISVKATTTEKLGFTGREEGIAAQAVVLLEQMKT